MSKYYSFCPDLIIEATSICDRACSGCYAPNVVTKNSAQLYSSQPELFLNPKLVEKILGELQQPLSVVAIRGGEPTQHPELPVIIKSCLNFSRAIVVETHGRWLLSDSRSKYEPLLSEIQNSNAIIKLSFDKMHGLSAEELKDITIFMESRKIRYLVAITEIDSGTFEISRKLCDWISDEQIIHQQKAKALSDLIAPPLGVLTTAGQLKKTLTTRHEFYNRTGYTESASGHEGKFAI